MKAIDIVRVRLDSRAVAHMVDAPPAESPDLAPAAASRRHDQQLCLHLLHQVARLSPRAARRWRVALLPSQRTPGAGIYTPPRKRPVVTLRLYAARKPSRPDGSQPDESRPDASQVVEAEIERDLAFPHSLPAILNHLEARVAPLQLVQPIRRVTLDTGARHDNLRGPSTGRPGAPLLACNQWLEDELACLPDPDDYIVLYAGWLKRYHAARGYYPQDPRRSFRAAVAGARRRLGH